jgi:hypothetical protein
MFNSWRWLMSIDLGELLKRAGAVSPTFEPADVERRARRRRRRCRILVATALSAAIVPSGLLVARQTQLERVETLRSGSSDPTTERGSVGKTIAVHEASPEEAGPGLRTQYAYLSSAGLAITSGDGAQSETITMPEAPGYSRTLIGASAKVLISTGSSAVVIDPRHPRTEPVIVKGVSGHSTMYDGGIWVAAMGSPTSQRTWRLLNWQGFPLGPIAVLPRTALLFGASGDGVAAALFGETNEIVLTSPSGLTHVGKGLPLASNASKVVFLEEAGSRVVEFDVATRGSRVLGSLGSAFAAQTIGAAAISGDGSRLAVVTKTGPPYQSGDVYVFSLDGDVGPADLLRGVSGTRIAWLSDSDRLVLSGDGPATVTSATTGASVRLNVPPNVEIFALGQ